MAIKPLNSKSQADRQIRRSIFEDFVKICLDYLKNARIAAAKGCYRLQASKTSLWQRLHPAKTLLWVRLLSGSLSIAIIFYRPGIRDVL
jgi:hypothetical protein